VQAYPLVLLACPLEPETSMGEPIWVQIAVGNLADARTGAGQRLGSLDGPGLPGALARWSASGRHVAYYARDLRRIVLVNLQRRSESVVRLPAHVGTGNGFVVPSPNGTQLIAGTRLGANQTSALWLVFGNGQRWRRLQAPSGESVPIAWQRDGWIYLVRNRGIATDHRGVHMELWRMRGPSGRPGLYAALPEGCTLPVSISVDVSRGVVAVHDKDGWLGAFEVFARLLDDALFGAAREREELQETLDNLEEFVNALHESEELRSFFYGVQIPEGQKRRAIDTLTEEMTASTTNFLKVLIDNGRMEILEEAVVRYEDLVKEHEGKVEVEFVTAVELSDEEARSIVRQIEEASGRKVEAKREVDRDLVGGIVLQVGSMRIDASVRGRLERLRRDLLVRS
jgi:F-type H+-transporting ATPase subunit delta